MQTAIDAFHMFFGHPLFPYVLGVFALWGATELFRTTNGVPMFFRVLGAVLGAVIGTVMTLVVALVCCIAYMLLNPPGV